MANDDNAPDRVVTRAERYRSQLHDAQSELDRVEQELEEVERQRAGLLARKDKLKTTIEILQPIYEEQEQEEQEQLDALWTDVANLGIQECCYRVLVEEAKPMAASSIQYALRDRGIKMEQKNPLAVIHTSLKRIPERVKTFKKREWVDDAQTRVAWVRYYEAIRPEKLKPTG